jgi:hypothetical protein
MSKEAARRTQDKSTSAPRPAEGAMQVYLRYLRSDTKPVPETEHYTVRSQLDAWRARRRAL